MNFNLSTLLEIIHRESDISVDFLLPKNSKFIVKSGDKIYAFDNEKLEDVLKDHSFTHFHKPDTIEKINEVLSTHIINQLSTKN